MKSRFWNDLKLGQKGLLTALFPSVALLIGFIALYALSTAERRAQRRVSHTLDVRQQIAHALTALNAEEASARGFVLTGDQDLRDDEARARDEVVQALTRLAGSVIDNDSQVGRVGQVRTLVNECHRLNEAIMNSGTIGDHYQAADLVADGLRQTEAARNLLLQMEAEEILLHTQRGNRLEQLRDLNIVATAITAAMGISGGFVAVYLLSRSTVRRIQWIGDDAERVAAGLPLQEKGEGRDEIGRVNEQLKAASALLTARTTALRESEARLQAILDNASSIIFMKDLKGRFMMANAQLERIFGLNQDEVIGRDVYAFWPKEAADSYAANDREALARTEPMQFEEVVPHEEGDRTYLSVKFALRDADGSPYAVCGISTDITERKKAEEILRHSRDELEGHVAIRTSELQEANNRLRKEVVQHQETAETLKRTNAQLLQAQKMEALGQIAGGIAHDFNNILTTIMGHGALLLQQMPEGERDRSSVAEILRASERAGALSKQLLSFSRPQPTMPVVLSLNSAMEGAEKMLAQAIGSRIALRKSLEPKLDSVRADRSQVEQLLLNFVINARDAIRGQGEIEITTANVHLAPEEVKCEAETNDFVSISIRDTGEGIPPAMMGRIFEPFFTTKRPGQGTGLGLATCSAIVQQSGGWIACHSQVGKGTRFTVYLPCVREAIAPTLDRRKSTALQKGHETVLVVEDEPAVGNLFENMLKKLGYNVLRAEHGEEAEQALASRSKEERPVDLVLTDLDMPRMDGAELVRRLAHSHQDVKIILTSGNGETFRYSDAGVEFEFLPKPFNMQTLAAKLREVLDR